MSNWIEQDTNKMRQELENIYMLALRKRAITNRYPEGFPEVPARPIGPKSADEDWDHIIRFCEQAGLRSSVLRTLKTESQVAPRYTAESSYDDCDVVIGPCSCGATH